MTGEKPVNWPTTIFTLLFGCYGCICLGVLLSPAHAEGTDAKQADMIPQEEVVVQSELLSEKLPITYSLRIYKEPDRIKLKGNMASEEDYKTFIGLIKANFPAISLSDRIKIDEDVPNSEVKIGGLNFALKLLGYLENGHASVDNNGLTLEGSASTAVVLTEVKQLLENDKPTGVPLKNIRIAPPAKSWNASVSSEKIVKISGVIPSRESKKAISDYASQKFPNFQIEDTAAINNKLSERWAHAAQKSLDLLFLLETGSVEITEETIRLKGDAPSETSLGLFDSIAKDLPSGFALKSEVTAPAPAPPAGVAAVPLADTPLTR